MEDNFSIFFVKNDKDEKCISILLEAFEALKHPDHDFNPQWISQEDCLTMETATKQNYKIFIFNPFEGPSFEHLKSLGHRIYGPRCILSNLKNGLVLPQNKKRPILNLAMKDVKICCTSIDKDTRESISKMVNLMAGEMAGDLTEDVTHLVVGEVGSSKYKVALANDKSLMTKEWVYDVWEASQHRHIMATDEVFKKYKCPIFLGLTVVVSGFSSNERNQMKNFVTKGGGKYSGEMKMNECTHLIVKEPKGAKYEAARNWGVKIVRDRWLYDCMDKGRYLDIGPYEFSNSRKGAKTSTPERLSVAGPNMMDVSTIPVASDCTIREANESEMQGDQYSFAVNTVAESKLGVTGLEADVTVQPADIFLDGCKIYLSGIKNSIQEKLKKIITAGGGFRAQDLTEAVTHVVMDEVIAADIAIVNKMTESPRLVSSNWLMDCFAQNVRLDEDTYLRTDVDITQHDRKKIRVPAKFPSDVDNKFGDKKNAERLSSDSNKNGSNEKTDFDMESDLMMANILSQYTQGGDDNKTVVKGDSDMEITRVDKGEEEMTQDPTDWDDADDGEGYGGVFHKKTFMLFGIDGNADDIRELEESVKANGGRIIHQGKKRQIADYGIVPLQGFEVKATVSEVLTVIWLQMCMEKQVLVPSCHWLARPIELPDEEILNDLCISVSGYIGVEREMIMYLVSCLGGLCQEHFCRTSSKKKNVVGSTHLIVDASQGSKYNAARKWNIPAVGKEWLEACIQSKQRVSEEPYDISVLEMKQKQQEEEEKDVTSADKSRDETSCQNPEDGHKAMDVGEPASVKSVCGSRTDSTNSDCNLSTTERSSRLPSDQTPSPTTKENLKEQPTRDADPEPMEINNHELDGGKKAACQPNQTDNIKAAYSTPTITTPLDRRRKKLALQGPIDSPNDASTPLGLIKGGGETPGTFQHPDFRPKFNVGQFLSPETPQTAKDLNTSTPLGEVFSRQIKKAAQNAANLCQDDATPSSQSTSELPPLHGVIIAVAKKLGRNHATYNQLVVELGGGYSWQYNDSVTHFVFQGRVNDTNKEFRTARSDGKLIVSPHWLTVCKEQGCRVDESIFPHHYNPLAASKETPSKSVRSTRNRGMSGDTPSRATVPSKTPSRKMAVLDIQEAPSSSIRKPPTQTPVSTRTMAASRKDSNTDNESHSPEKISRLSESVTSHQLQPQEEEEQHLVVPNETSPGPVLPGETVTPVCEDTSTTTVQGNKLLDSKSQEMKDALAKTLGSVLEEASRSKKNKKKKGRLTKLSGGQLSASGVKTPENGSRTGTPSTWVAKEPEKPVQQFPEPSQSLQVTWDDPTERLEKEKLAHRLERVCDPSQNTDDFMAGIELPSTFEQTKEPQSERSPTPEAPSLAFPVPRPATHVHSPQPITLLSDESCDGRLADNQVKETPMFLFSGMKNEERVEYGALVEQLGGKFLEKQHFDPACTHLVVSQPVRNEKYLSSIAAGKWVLHKSYLEACRRENKLVSEENHEWGSSYTTSIMLNMTSQAFKLASAAHKWRKKVFTMKKNNPGCKGAFDGWKVMLCLSSNKEDNFKRMLHAGGAEVVSMRPPFPDNLDATHAFLDTAKVKIPQADLIKLIHQGLHCLAAEYIAAYLTDDPLPDPSDFYNTEIVALKASMPDQSMNSSTTSRKRRVPSGEDSGGSRKMSRT